MLSSSTFGLSVCLVRRISSSVPSYTLAEESQLIFGAPILSDIGITSEKKWVSSLPIERTDYAYFRILVLFNIQFTGRVILKTCRSFTARWRRLQKRDGNDNVFIPFFFQRLNISRKHSNASYLSCCDVDIQEHTVCKLPLFVTYSLWHVMYGFG